MPKITELFAFVVEDKDGDDEGVMGMSFNGEWMPFLGADIARVKSIKPFADHVARVSGKRYKVLRFKLDGEIK